MAATAFSSPRRRCGYPVPSARPPRPSPLYEGCAHYQRIFALNVIAPFQMVRACREALKASRGAVVNVSSVASVLGTGSSVAYAASKAALETMSLSLARSLAPEVRVNVVAPGHTNTPWHAQMRGLERAAEVEKRYSTIAPLKQISQAEDVADAIVWLIEGGRNVTGE